MADQSKPAGGHAKQPPRSPAALNPPGAVAPGATAAQASPVALLRTSARHSPTLHRCPYAGCFKAFDRRYNLKCHQRIHSDEKPYRCHHDNCARSFRWKSSLNHHLMSLDHATPAARLARRSGIRKMQQQQQLQQQKQKQLLQQQLQQQQQTQQQHQQLQQQHRLSNAAALVQQQYQPQHHHQPQKHHHHPQHRLVPHPSQGQTPLSKPLCNKQQPQPLHQKHLPQRQATQIPVIPVITNLQCDHSSHRSRQQNSNQMEPSMNLDLMSHARAPKTPSRVEISRKRTLSLAATASIVQSNAPRDTKQSLLSPVSSTPVSCPNLKMDDVTTQESTHFMSEPEELYRNSASLEMSTASPSACSIEVNPTSKQNMGPGMCDDLTQAASVLGLSMFSTQHHAVGANTLSAAIQSVLPFGTSASFTNEFCGSASPPDMSNGTLDKRMETHPTNSSSTIQTDMDGVLLKDEHQYSSFSFDVSDATGFSDLFSTELSDASSDQYTQKYDSRPSSATTVGPDIAPPSTLFSGVLTGDDLVHAILSGGVDMNLGLAFPKTFLP